MHTKLFQINTSVQYKEVSGVYLFPFSTFCANMVTLLRKSWSSVVDVLFIKYQFEMSVLSRHVFVQHSNEIIRN